MIRVQRRKIAGPTAAGIEFGIGFEKRCITTYAAIDSGFSTVPVFTSVRPLGALLTGDVKGFGGQNGSPLLCGFVNFSQNNTYKQTRLKGYLYIVKLLALVS